MAIKDFDRVAQQLARNPLGIIALFIVLVYGIAGLSLGFSTDVLQPSERMPIVWFLVVFPVLVLFAFYRLVSNHHVKLYAPNDFIDADGFFRAMTPTEHREKLESAVQQTGEDPPSPDLRGRLGVKEAAMSVMRQQVLLAEDLAFRELEQEHGATAHRGVAVVGHGPVDGLLMNKNGVRVVEVKTARPASFPAVAERATEHLRRLASTMQGVTILLAFVVEAFPHHEIDEARQLAEGMAKRIPLPTEVRIYDFMELKKKYGLEG